jgi:3-deoxy-D-manno-octulosonic-acid transferase
VVAGVAQARGLGARQEKISLSFSSSPPRITLAHRAAGFVGAGFLRFVQLTSATFKWDHPQALSIRRNRRPCVYAFWHNKQVYLAVEHRGERVSIMVSRSKDGEYIAQVMKRLGLCPVRGSTSKGGDNALREMIGLLKDGHQVGFTPDGPRGPLHTVHGGVALTAQSTTVPVVPTTYFASNRITFRSWDQFVLPLPFGRVLTAHGRPLRISAGTSIEDAKRQIQDALLANERDAQIAFADGPSRWGEYVANVAFRAYGVLAILLSPIVALVASLVFGFKRGGRFLGERFSIPPRREGFTSPLWFHAASVGEWQALKPLLHEIKTVLPESSGSILITVSTPEARLIVAKEAPEALVRLMPVDVPWLLRSWFARLRPRALVIVETEIWPNLIRAASCADVPIFIVNGRLSERSFGRWKFVKPLIRHLLFKVNMVFARSVEDAQRFKQLGVAPARLSVAGNTKVDNVDVRADTPLFASPTPVLIGGSTWPGEEALLLALIKDAAPGRARLILAPRRLERVAEIRTLIEKTELSFSLYSQIKAAGTWDTDVLLVDTLGDLKTLYSSASVAFVGGSVYPHGGQNPLEPAAAGLPTVFGASMTNFHDEAAGLIAAGAALRGDDAQGVRDHLQRLLNDADERRRLGTAAAEYIRVHRGAARRIAERLGEWLANT